MYPKWSRWRKFIMSGKRNRPSFSEKYVGAFEIETARTGSTIRAILLKADTSYQ